VRSLLDRDEAVASRVDEAARVREEALFVGDGPKRVFASVRLPLEGAATAGVVLCPALHEDFMRTYRKETLLARFLAPRGLAVLRFDYVGMGNSDGDAEDASFESMTENALASASWLRARAEVDAIAFVGTRWGAMVAAAAARDHDAPLALWEPALDGRGYFREAFRANRIHAAKERRAHESEPSTAEELRSRDVVDVLGYPLRRSFYEDANERRLDAELGDRPRRLLLVQVGRGERLRPDYERLAAGLGERGFDVESAAIDGDETWWFTGARWQAEERRPGTQRLVERTADWLVHAVGGSA
jgi:alpha/beta superfamily hydrolase